MQKLKKPNKQSGKAQLALLIAVALTAGAAGVWSELQAAGASVTKVASYQVSANAGNASFQIIGQPDGTVWVQGGAWSGSSQVDVSDWNAQGNLQVSGKGSVNGPRASGSATALGNLWDWSGPSVTPATVDISIEVHATTGDWNGGASSNFNVHQLQIQDNNWNGVDDPRVVRVHQTGTQAWTPNGGAVSVSVNGAPFTAGSGGSGQLNENTTHTIDKIK